ncbi:MAG: spore germination protein [Candidatus Pristimantibacillus sp.]
MPSAVGFVNITSVGSGSIVQFGDVVQVSPSSTSKTYAGSGSFLTGNLANSNNAVSATNTADPDLVDSSISKIGSGVNVV